MKRFEIKVGRMSASLWQAELVLILRLVVRIVMKKRKYLTDKLLKDLNIFGIVLLFKAKRRIKINLSGI